MSKESLILLCYYSLVTVHHDTPIWLSDSEKLIFFDHFSCPTPLLLTHQFSIRSQVKHDVNSLPLNTSILGHLLQHMMWGTPRVRVCDKVSFQH